MCNIKVKNWGDFESYRLRMCQILGVIKHDRSLGTTTVTLGATPFIVVLKICILYSTRCQPTGATGYKVKNCII